MNSPSQNQVLIVDDEPTMRWMLAEVLRDWNYETLEAESGASLLATLEAAQPTAVLLDINLPDNSGLNLLREIKRRQPQAAVIMMTAQTLFENAVVALRGGADDFISKPINLEELRFALEQSLNLKRSSRAPVAVSKPRALIISDSAECIPRWLAAFDPQEVEISCVVFPEEWGYVSGNTHDLALVDISPPLLELLLKSLRASTGHAEIPVLVENGEIAATSSADVVARYCVIPGSYDDLIRLARRRISGLISHAQAQRLHDA